jgi:hypothetical protein
MFSLLWADLISGPTAITPHFNAYFTNGFIVQNLCHKILALRWKIKFIYIFSGIKNRFTVRRILAKEVKVLYVYFSWKYICKFKFMDPAYDSKCVQESSSYLLWDFKWVCFLVILKLLWSCAFFLTAFLFCMRGLHARHDLLAPLFVPDMTKHTQIVFIKVLRISESNVASTIYLA